MSTKRSDQFARSGTISSNERMAAIEEEVQKLLYAGFIWAKKYPTWLANVVMVKNPVANGACASITLTSIGHVLRIASLSLG